MAGERSYVQIPPDGTGKKIRHEPFHRVGYGSRVGGHLWQLEQEYQIIRSSVTLMTVTIFTGPNSDSGYVGIKFPGSQEFQNVSLQSGDLISYQGSTVATVTSDEIIHIPYTQISGGSSPHNTVNVDNTGSMNMRFAEGAPQVDAFGKLRTSGATILGEYTFSDNTLNDSFSSIKWGSGTITHDDNLRCMILSTGTGTATANFGPDADRAQHTSNTYHHYFPGISQTAIMTVALGNANEPGVMREWGYFDGIYDDDITGTPTYELTGGNGYFFRHVGTNGLELVIRSSATGVITERVIRRDETLIYSNNSLQSTTQDGWNKDPVDGTGDSQKILNLENDNIYWVDVQWLGAGRIRFGTYHRGERVVIHEYYHDENGGVPHSQTGSLPVRFCIHNMAGQNVSTAANMKVWCASVFAEADIDLSGQGRGQVEYLKCLIDPANMNDVNGVNELSFSDGRGTRGITTKTSISSSGTTLTVPNLTGIYPGWLVQDSDGYLPEGTTVTDIINSTTIQVSDAPTTAFNGDENVSFNMPVQDEYYLIGIFSPVETIADNVGANRTLYLPRAMRAWAYYENGDPAYVSFQVYADPIMSGNYASLPIGEQEAEDAGIRPLLVRHELNDPFCGVEVYGKEGIDKVNYFGRGFHALVTYNSGDYNGGMEDLSGAFGNFANSFKLRSDGGGNNRCPILKVFQSPSAGQPTVIQINTPPTGVDYSLHREGNAIQFEQIPGLIGTDATYGLNRNASGEVFYLRMIGLDKAELYTDKDFQTPWDTSALSNASNGNSLTWPGNTGDVATGGFILSGYGPYLYFAVVVKPQGPSQKDSPYFFTNKGKIECNFALYWNEIKQ